MTALPISHAYRLARAYRQVAAVELRRRPDCRVLEAAVRAILSRVFVWVVCC